MDNKLQNHSSSAHGLDHSADRSSSAHHQDNFVDRSTSARNASAFSSRPSPTHSTEQSLVQRFVAWLDPKLSRFRAPENRISENRTTKNRVAKSSSFRNDSAQNSYAQNHSASESQPQIPPAYSPKTLKEFLAVVKRTPLSVLSAEDRATMASAISFRDRRVSDIMLPRGKITFVHEHDFMGPLTLDKLYQSGQTHFPVLSKDGKQLIGVIHTSALNSLDVKSSASDRASKYVDPTIYYLRDDYTLEQALAAFMRTNSFFYMVINHSGHTVGLLTYETLTTHLLGYEPKDDFSDDTSISAVMNRPQRNPNTPTDPTDPNSPSARQAAQSNPSTSTSSSAQIQNS